MLIEDFDPVATELHKGISLIEASAGTGKTYTIAMLVLRLVVERGVPIDKLLVVTFTKAATEELKDRIRSRLAEAKRALIATVDSTDNAIKAWLSGLDLSPELIKRRLDFALLDIDQAGIFTIHGFCQRVLREHALASGQLFDAELTDDLASIKQACADDFWRKQIQNRAAWEAAILTKDFKSPDDLLSSIDFVGENAIIYPSEQNIDECLNPLKKSAEIAKSKLADTVQKIEVHISGKQFKTGYQDSFSGNCKIMDDWLEGNTNTFPSAEALSFLTYGGILNGLNGTQFRSNKAQSSDERKEEFLDSLVIDTKPFDDLEFAAKQVTVILRRSLLETLREELDKQLEQINLWSFDNLITHLAKALQGVLGQQLINELRQRFDAALIDEFQDTDNNQWHIFSSIFATECHYLVLVGDPKQAIYKFRGADIYSYLAAQSQAQYHYTLGYNWRSHPKLVSAVNALFQREQAFLLPDIAFHPTKSARSEKDGSLCFQALTCPPLMLWQLPESSSKSGFWQANRNDAAETICLAVANEILALLTKDYSLQPQNQAIKPQDIAILVRTNQQARDFQDILRLSGVPSVLNSTESVFASDEAINLYTLLLAIAHPGDINLLGQALALSWFGYDGQTLYRILNNEVEVDTILTRFLAYFQTWQQCGVMAMMQSLMVKENLPSVLSKSELAERRLTNLQHTLELVQQAVIDEHLGIHLTLGWLKAAITKAHDNPGSPDAQQLRLESDADAVKIITMHRSKGLEYPVVFCPYLWERKDRFDKKNPLVKCHLPTSDEDKTNKLILDLGSSELDKHHAQAQYEELAEELRLAYVAVTRAKYRCYIVWANVRSENTPNNSSLAWLMDFAEQDFSEQQATLQALQKQDEESFAYRLLELSDKLNSRYQVSGEKPRLVALKRQRSLYTDWQMSSYTALSELSLAESPELPKDRADEIDYTSKYLPTFLPSGAHTGNVIHDLLENIPFVDFANKQDISVLRDLACQRYGLKLEQPEVIDALLYKTVTTPLSLDDPLFCLRNLLDGLCIKELPFYLSLSTFKTQQINEILNGKTTFQPLSQKQMSGYLTGFIDLICKYGEQFYVMDYKTNLLPDYQPQTLTVAMREHNYGLQYWLYSVVLHRYLQNRLSGYNYKQHFGGVRYLFVRGMEPGQAMSGVFKDKPDLPTLEALASQFMK